MARPAPSELTSWPGSKGASGVAERICSLFPVHAEYVEPFVGGGAVFRRKAPALRSVLIDSDPAVSAAWARSAGPGVAIVEGDGVSWLRANAGRLGPDALVYADPPYVHSTRSHRRLYHEEWSDELHASLLAVLEELSCSVFLSGYASKLYDDALATWQRVEFPAMTRGGVRTEVLWYRIAEGVGVAGDVVGWDYRERERVKRKASRWAAKFAALPEPERVAIWKALLAVSDPPSSCSTVPPGQSEMAVPAAWPATLFPTVEASSDGGPLTQLCR